MNASNQHEEKIKHYRTGCCIWPVALYISVKLFNYSPLSNGKHPMSRYSNVLKQALYNIWTQTNKLEWGHISTRTHKDTQFCKNTKALFFFLVYYQSAQRDTSITMKYLTHSQFPPLLKKKTKYIYQEKFYFTGTIPEFCINGATLYPFSNSSLWS